MLRALCGLGLLAPSLASAQYIRSYDFSTGLLPEEQGWGLETEGDMTRGSSLTPPTFEEGGMRSNTMGLPLSGTGHQWWYEYVPYEPWPPCTMRSSYAWWDPYEFYPSTGAYLEFEIKVIESTYGDDGFYVRTGWNTSYGDFWQKFNIGLTDSGYLIGNELLLTVDTDTGGIRPFDTSDFHVYRLSIDEAGAHLYIDGVYQESVPYGAPLPDPEIWGYAHAMFGDGQGWLDGINSDTIIRSFEYGCTPENLPPIAVDDVADGSGVIEIDVLANDSDPDGDAIVVVEVTEPSNGTVVYDPTGLVTYTPDPDYEGPDSFTYTIVDGNGGVSTATVTVEVSAGFILDLTGSCPGWNDVTVSGLLPDEQFVLMRAADVGAFVIPGGACEGVVSGLGAPANWVGRLAFRAGDDGTWEASTLIREAACDDVWRAVSLDSCRLSNLEQSSLD